MTEKRVQLRQLCEGPSIANDIARLRDLSMAELLDEYHGHQYGWRSLRPGDMVPLHKIGNVELPI